MEAACPTCGGSAAAPGVVDDPQKLAELIHEVLRLRIANETGLVSNVCDECRERLEQIRTFVCRARAACLALRLLGEEIAWDLERQDKETQIDPSLVEECEDQFIQEHEIKQEPEDYDFDECVQDQDDVFMNDDSIHQIKIEPLSEDEALKFHREASGDVIMTDTISNMPQEIIPSVPEDIEQNVPSETNSKVAEEATQEINVHVESEKEDVEYLDEDFEPSPEELYLYRIRTEDQKGPATCNLCGGTFDCQISLEKHVSLHYNLAEKCLLCNEQFDTRQKLKRHVILHHSYNELLQCCMCGQYIRNLAKAVIHKSSLEDVDVELCCALCQEEFAKKLIMKMQKKTHSEKPLLNKSNEEIIQCARCNRTFDDIRDLYPHVAACDGHIASALDFGHSNDSSFRNELEDSSSLSPSPPKTSYSNRVVTSLNNSNGDELNHKLNNGYECPLCSQTFTHRFLLRIHIEDHNSITRDYSCPLCMFKFKRKDHLKRHLLNVH